MPTLPHTWSKFTGVLPRGRTLPVSAWRRRHRALLWILWGHVAFLPAFSLYRGMSVGASLGWTMPIALAGIVGELPGASRRLRSSAVVLGLLTASAVLVGAWDGQIEAHFHFFVMIAIVALYEDWVPFGLAIAYVVIEHGLLGAISPRLVYSHGGNPWAWALVHGIFVLGAVAASVVTWRLNEDMRDLMEGARRRERDVAECFQLAFESSLAGMALVGPDGQFMSVNHTLCEMLGYSRPELRAASFQSITHPDDRDADVEGLGKLLDGSLAAYETEKRYIHRAGHDVWVHLGVSPVRDEHGRVSYFITQINDVSERRRVQAELAHRALHDHLTGLPNRALLLDRVRHALVRARRRSETVALLFVDLDDFKLVNDGIGHRAGDHVLMSAAQRLSATARADDTVARFGGDEFTILCENTGHADACALADRLIAAFATPFRYEEREIHLTVSIGIRVTDVPAITPDALIRDADIALYAAKEHGRNGYDLFDPAQRRRPDPLATAQALREAVRNDELCLHYQPTVELATGRITGVEALVRWDHPERGLIPPGDFIPTAEASGLIVPIGEWVLAEACEQLAVWQRAGVVGRDIRVAVNVSGRQLSRPELPEVVARVLATTGLDPACLCLEITESAVIANPIVGLDSLAAIKAQGVGLALDDFGVGFSSLSQIRDLPPVDVIKVDRSFTAGLGENESDTAVVTAVMSLARSLQLAAVAEGVETAAQIELLSALDCDIGQGFFFSRPLPALQIAGLLSGGALPLTDASARGRRDHVAG